MNLKMIARIQGYVLLCLAALLILPLTAGLCYGESVLGFLITMGIAAVLGGALVLFFRPSVTDLYAKEGFASVGLAWIVMSLLGALPFVISGDIPNYIDAVFETASGFTTTGASILNDVESLSRGGLFWRSTTHWIGGMGVLVFLMAVLPLGEGRAMHIMRAEVPGPTVGKLVPRARKTAAILYLIYLGLTVAETIFLLLGGMSFYDAILHAFASAGTGGFSTRGASIAAFDSVYIEMVISVFLLLFGVNFNLYYLILIGRARDALKSEELHCYLGLLAFATLTIAGSIFRLYGSVGASLRHAFFNTVSLLTTAGFGTEDFTRWPGYAQALLVLLMFIGGCAGSTGGGLKLSRVILLVKTAGADLQKMIRPRSVPRVQMDGRRVGRETTDAVYGYFALYMLLLLGCTLILSLDGYDFATNFTASLSCMSNIGPGLGLVGPTGNFAIFSALSKIAMTLTMLCGRLEIYAVVILFIPSTWKNR